MSRQASVQQEERAKNIFGNYKEETPEESFAYGGYDVYVMYEEYLKNDYTDEEFDSWVKAVYKIYKSPDLVVDIIEKYESEADEDDNHKDYYQVDIDLLESIFEPFNIPEPLRGLVEYQNKTDSSIINFHVNVSGNEYVKYFCDSEEFISKIVVFGSFIDGDMFAYWKVGREFSDFPIVKICGGVDGSSVMARSIEEFLSLLCEGVDTISTEIGEASYHPPEDDDPIFVEETDNLRNFLLHSYGIAPAVDPDEIKRKALREFPDFEQWMLKLYYESTGRGEK